MHLQPWSTLSVATLVTAFALSACTTLINPHLDSSPLDATTACDSGEVAGPNRIDCSPAGRFRTTVKAVQEIQNGARNAYKERTQVNTVTSALAFPIAGALLYRGVTTGTDAGRRLVLKEGIGAAAAYEARNALLANSPEGTYLQAEARLGCLLDEAARYRPEVPTSCQEKAEQLRQFLADVSHRVSQNRELERERKAAVARVSAALDRYDNTIPHATLAMRQAARKIVIDTNAHLPTPSVSLAQAASLVRSGAGQIGALPAPSAEAPTGQASLTEREAHSNALEALSRLTNAFNSFRAVCVPPQPKDTAGFDACTTVTISTPPVATITTTLASNTVTMRPGDVLTFVATSSMGTPWATLSDPLLGPPEQLTLAPTQTQVTVRYPADKAVAADTDVVLTLSTIGGTAGTASVTLSLQAKPGTQAGNAGNASSGSTGPPTGDSNALAIKDPDLAPFVTTDAVWNQLGINKSKDGATVEDVRRALDQLWHARCNKAPGQKPDPTQLVSRDFLKVLEGAPTKNLLTSPVCQPK